MPRSSSPLTAPRAAAGVVIAASTIAGHQGDEASYVTLAVGTRAGVRFAVGCLQCGAWWQSAPCEVVVADMPTPAALMDAICGGWCDAHDASGCLTPTIPELAAQGPTAVVSALRATMRGRRLETALQLWTRLARGGGRPLVWYASATVDPVELEPGVAGQVLQHDLSSPILHVWDATVHDALEPGAHYPVRALGVPDPSLGSGASRWWLMLPDRVLPIATLPRGEQLQVTVTPEPWRLAQGTGVLMPPMKLVTALAVLLAPHG